MAAEPRWWSQGWEEDRPRRVVDARAQENFQEGMASSLDSPRKSLKTLGDRERGQISEN